MKMHKDDYDYGVEWQRHCMKRDFFNAIYTILHIAAIIAGLYLFGAFISLSWNPLDWKPEERGIAAAIALIAVPAAVLIRINRLR